MLSVVQLQQWAGEKEGSRKKKGVRFEGRNDARGGGEELRTITDSDREWMTREKWGYEIFVSISCLLMLVIP